MEANNIQVFSNETFGSIRSVMVEDEPYFVGADIANALGYANARDAIEKHVDDEDKQYITRTELQQLKSPVSIRKPLGEMCIPNRGLTMINESGIYSLVFGSKLESAKKFKKWVTSEVLPSIRKRGAYATDNFIEQAIADPDFAIRMIAEMKEERVKRIAAEEKANAQAILLEQAAPKIQFAETFAQCKGSILVGEMAKMLHQAGCEKVRTSSGVKTMGQNTLFEWLRERHYLGMYGEYKNVPNQQYIAQGLFELKKNVHSENDTLVTTTTTKVTAKGQQYFLNKPAEFYTA